MKHGNIWTICHIKSKNKKQTATMPTNVAGMSALAGGVSGVPATAVPGGLQSASMASIELGKKRMRDSNDDLLMVPRLMHEVHFPFLVAGPYENGPLRGFSSQDDRRAFQLFNRTMSDYVGLCRTIFHSFPCPSSLTRLVRSRKHLLSLLLFTVYFFVLTCGYISFTFVYG